MPGAVFLTDGDVTLRTIEEDDLPFLRDTVNDPAVRRHLGQRGPFNLAQERTFYEEVVCDDSSLNLLICSDTEPVGTIGLSAHAPTDGSTEIGLFLADEFWNQGIGTTASRLVLAHAFTDRRIHRVVARVIEGNEASTRLWERLGFRHEATHREARLPGRWVRRRPPVRAPRGRMGRRRLTISGVRESGRLRRSGGRGSSCAGCRSRTSDSSARSWGYGRYSAYR